MVSRCFFLAFWLILRHTHSHPWRKLIECLISSLYQCFFICWIVLWWFLAQFSHVPVNGKRLIFDIFSALKFWLLNNQLTSLFNDKKPWTAGTLKSGNPCVSPKELGSLLDGVHAICYTHRSWLPTKFALSWVPCGIPLRDSTRTAHTTMLPLTREGSLHPQNLGLSVLISLKR